eukprot:3938260-Rhodomonas_salina.1
MALPGRWIRHASGAREGGREGGRARAGGCGGAPFRERCPGTTCPLLLDKQYCLSCSGTTAPIVTVLPIVCWYYLLRTTAYRALVLLAPPESYLPLPSLCEARVSVTTAGTSRSDCRRSRRAPSGPGTLSYRHSPI